ncbi:TPA: hypothetical protein JAJ00_001501 [Clostridioides difficile]|nr:hypothetical protein [Clostridioides difficile]HBF5857585.1 hypothetical protein [Clostridioides difficile]
MKRKIKLKNVFIKENDENNIYYVCNACKKDIYICEEKEEFDEWEYKK